MKHLIATLCMAATVAACTSSKGTSGTATLAGEWEITQIEGQRVDAAESEETPFLGFDAKAHNLYGSAGCNSLTGTYRANASRGTLDLSQVGCTRMLCANMQTEQRVLGALEKIHAYTVLPDGTLSLNDRSGKAVMLLQPKGK